MSRPPTSETSPGGPEPAADDTAPRGLAWFLARTPPLNRAIPRDANAWNRLAVAAFIARHSPKESPVGESTYPAPDRTPDVPEPPDDRPTASRDAVQRARTDGGTRAPIANAMWRRDTIPSTAAQTGGYVWEFADRIAELAVPEIERRVRKQVAAEIEARGVDLRGDDENPLSREEWACYGDAASIARGEAR